MSKKKKDWKTEKERLLHLDLEERRKEYRRQDFISLDKIPSWREENGSNDKEEGKVLKGGRGITDKISLYKGDITVLEVDAIVNAANPSLLGGGGDVIHTVGPVARGHVGPTEKNDLTSCYQNSLRLLTENGSSTVAFPCISTGIYGFPNEPAAEIALNTVKSWIEENPDKITRVIFCVFLETDFAIYKKKMSLIFQDNDMEVAEEQPKGDDTPPSTNSTTKEDNEDGNKGKDETGDDEEGDNDAGGNEDVEMESQTPEQNLENKEEDQEMSKDEKQEEDIGITDKDEDKNTNNNKNNDASKAEEEKPAKQTEDNTAESTVEMEDDGSDNTGTSNAEAMKDLVESSEEPNSIPTDSTQSKDNGEKSE
ncbi:ADP-ribose glycohydrolase MACROD2 isoform X10 [Channa argus]|uniref:ADP-ribose glycohydrolase MACROD2 isoform X10 n=1 Tax=Channa argus TaxID=215402 RepID=UPI0035225C4D